MKRKHHDSPAQESGQSSEASPLPPREETPSSAARDDLAKLQAERDDLLSRLQRVSADYLNYQKRVQRDIEEGREYANAELIKSLLGVLDDMERGLDAARANHGADDPLLVGMELVHHKALETLGRFDLSVIACVGEAFNPARHSAIVQEESGEHPPMTVTRELQRGYLLKGRTLRPAMVAVSKAPSVDTPQPAPGQENRPGEK